jgi:hypothetical protein
MKKRNTGLIKMEEVKESNNKKLIRKSLIRGGIPFVILEIFAVALYFQEKYADSNDLFWGGFLILTLGAATVIYNIDNWSLPKQSIAHFSIMFLTVYPILLLSGWYPVTSFVDAFSVFITFLISGVVIFSVMLTLAKIFKW